MPLTHIGPYRIVRLLGEGGMGSVYEAIQEPIDRRVAIKVLLNEHSRHSDALQRFFNEARAANRIEHPSIVQVSEFGQSSDGMAYLVMEYLRGETLSSRLDRLRNAGGRMPLLTALHLAFQVADALTAAHDKGIIHRDMKPGNVMLMSDPVAPGVERVKILDFGIAKLTQGQGQGTKTNALIGTPQYMSPEQFRGAGGVDDRTDVYSLGVMLYEMLTGRPPFLAEDPVAYMGQHVFQEPPPLRSLLPDASVEVATLIHRLLIKDKASRPAMREVRAALEQLLSGASDRGLPLSLPMGMSPAVTSSAAHTALGTSASPSTLGHSLGQTLRSQGQNSARRTRLAALAILFIAVVIGVTALVTRRPTPAPGTATARQPPQEQPAAAPVAPHPTPQPAALPSSLLPSSPALTASPGLQAPAAPRASQNASGKPPASLGPSSPPGPPKPPAVSPANRTGPKRPVKYLD